ncbi:MAG: sugar ABC transporter substrate-binding protein [Prolixibacteraceae bacterium]
MKFIQKYLIGGLILLLLFSCKSKTDVKLGFLIPATEGSRWIIDKRYVENAAKDMGVEILVRSAENDENLQIKQANELLEEGVDVLIIVPSNANTAAAAVRDAHSYNVPVVAYDRLIKNCDLDYIVTFDGAKIGELMVEHAVSKVPKGNYVILFGDAGDVNAISIKNAQEAFLKPYVDRGDINIVYKTFVENWDFNNAYQIMKRVLSFTDQKIDAVITGYDGLAMGALKAIEEDGTQNVKVLTGQDSELNAVQAVVAGKMSLTIYKSIRETAEAAVGLAVKMARGETIESAKGTINNGRVDVPMLLLEPAIVEINTIKSTVIADKFYTEEEIYGK